MTAILKTLVGLFLIILGYWYIRCPSKISAINEWFRDHVFNDRHLIVHRKKIGVLLLLIGLVVFFMGLKTQ